MILGAIDVNNLNNGEISCDLPPKESGIMMIFDSLNLEFITNILLVVSIIFSIVLIIKYKEKRSLIIAIVALIITFIFYLMHYLTDGSIAIFEYEVYYRERLIEAISKIVINLTLFTYSTIKLVKCIKSDKFRKEK